ncbi:regulator of chromatin [Anaeramoeba flamelloides]|uniref:Regulator of chromatin n=1 Tax=Anaeramoeba flamelloides TaxID=1746091 RepID=A0ABQ8XCK8_9EUKA|nr:regulator of chromatin [Anaeramoeba flamelloides]
MSLSTKKETQPKKNDQQPRVLPYLAIQNNTFGIIRKNDCSLGVGSKFPLNNPFLSQTSRSQQELKTKKTKSKKISQINTNFQVPLVARSLSKNKSPRIQTVSYKRSRLRIGGDGFCSKKNILKSTRRNTATFSNNQKQQQKKWNQRKRFFIEPTFSFSETKGFTEKQTEKNIYILQNHKRTRTNSNQHLSNLTPKIIEFKKQQQQPIQEQQQEIREQQQQQQWRWQQSEQQKQKNETKSGSNLVSKENIIPIKSPLVLVRRKANKIHIQDQKNRQGLFLTHNKEKNKFQNQTKPKVQMGSLVRSSKKKKSYSKRKPMKTIKNYQELKKIQELKRKKQQEKSYNQTRIKKHLPNLFNRNAQLRLTEQYLKNNMPLEIEFKLLNSTHFYVTKPDILEVCNLYMRIDQWQFNEKMQTFCFPLGMYDKVLEKMRGLKHFNILINELPNWILLCLNDSNNNNLINKHYVHDVKKVEYRESITDQCSNQTRLSPKLEKKINNLGKDIFSYGLQHKGRIMLTNNNIFGKCVTPNTRVITQNHGILFIKDIFKRFADKKSKRIENFGEWYDLNPKILEVYSINPKFTIKGKNKNCTKRSNQSNLKIVQVGKIYREKVTTIIKFITSNGISHSVAPNHKLFTLQEGWVSAHELNIQKHSLIFSSPLELSKSIEFFNEEIANKFGIFFSKYACSKKGKNKNLKVNEKGKDNQSKREQKFFLLELTKLKNMENILDQFNTFSVKYKIIAKGKSNLKIGIHFKKSFLNILNFIENWNEKLIKIFLKSFFIKKSVYSIPIYNKKIANSICYQISKLPNKIGKIIIFKEKELKRYQIKIENTFNKYFSFVDIFEIKKKTFQDQNKKWVYDLSITNKDDPKTYLFNCLLGHNTTQSLSLASNYQVNWPLLIICKSTFKNDWFEKCKELLDFKKIKTTHPQLTSPSTSPSQPIIKTHSSPLTLISKKYNRKSKKKNINAKPKQDRNSITIVTYEDFEKNIEINQQLNEKCFGMAILDSSYILNDINPIKFQKIKKFLTNAKQLIIINQMFNLNKTLEIFPLLQLLQPKLFNCVKEFTNRYQFGSNQNELLILLEKIGVKINNNTHNKNNTDSILNESGLSPNNKITNNSETIMEGNILPKREQIIFKYQNNKEMKRILTNLFQQEEKIISLQKKKKLKKKQFQNLTKFTEKKQKYLNILSNFGILNKKKIIVSYLAEVVSSISLSSENNIKKLIIFAQNEKMIDEIANIIHENQFEFIKIIPNLEKKFANLLINRFNSQYNQCNIALISLKVDFYQKVFLNDSSLILFTEIPQDPNLIAQIEKEIAKSISVNKHLMYIQYLLFKNSLDVIHWYKFCTKMSENGIKIENIINNHSFLFHSNSSIISNFVLNSKKKINNNSKYQKTNYNYSKKYSNKLQKGRLNSDNDQNQQFLKLFFNKNKSLSKIRNCPEIEIDLDEEDSQSESEGEN